MPTYLYETIPAEPDVTPKRFEVRQGFDEPVLTSDPETGIPVRRVISGGMAVMSKGAQPLPDPGPGCGPGTCGCGRF